MSKRINIKQAQLPIIREIFTRFENANPQPTTELIWTTPFELLVAVMLSARTTDISVNQATRRLFAVANTPQSIYELGEEKLKNYLNRIGLYNNKTRNLLKICHILLTQYDGEVPRTRTELEALPGVGRKTANVVLNTAFAETTIAVDTHVFRVANRTGIAPGENPRAVEDQLIAVVPEEFQRNAHHWLILHGRYICTARQPRCGKCLIADLCKFSPKNI